MLYLVLTIGALTTLYPFGLMVATGLKGPTDQTDNKLIPKYLLDDKELLKKYVDDKYAGNTFDIESAKAGLIASPDVVQRYREFLQQLPVQYWRAGFRNAPHQVTGRLQNLYHEWLRKRYRAIDDLNKAYVEENTGFQTVSAPAELFERKDWKPTPGPKWDEWQDFKQSLPVEFRIPLRASWMWQKFLAAKFKNQFALVPAQYAGIAVRFEELSQPRHDPKRGPPPLIAEFEHNTRDNLLQKPIEDQWRAFAHNDEGLPVGAADLAEVQTHGGAIRKEFASRNYGYVLDYILLNGRAVWNTFLFCFLAILTQLTVNPLAAYALSRYPVRQSGKILIFLLATMAFPAEVAMIPSFLLLKDLHLLNTFAALVLPGAASGYMIFLLKGFFDSLPQELFEAGSLDGAKEITMMTKIALPMSRPVLGYLALLAFMGAYGAFIYAFLVAQDQKIWTLMVWIYQLQASGAPKAVLMAALTLAAVPTLLVFLFAQRVIMRGIVLPGER